VVAVALAMRAWAMVVVVVVVVGDQRLSVGEEGGEKGAGGTRDSRRQPTHHSTSNQPHDLENSSHNYHQHQACS
jgi:hypothetical protein